MFKPQPKVEVDVHTALEAIWLIRVLMRERPDFSLVAAKRVVGELLDAVRNTRLAEQAEHMAERNLRK